MVITSQAVRESWEGALSGGFMGGYMTTRRSGAQAFYTHSYQMQERRPPARQPQPVSRRKRRVGDRRSAHASGRISIQPPEIFPFASRGTSGERDGKIFNKIGLLSPALSSRGRGEG